MWTSLHKNGTRRLIDVVPSESTCVFDNGEVQIFDCTDWSRPDLMPSRMFQLSLDQVVDNLVVVRTAYFPSKLGHPKPICPDSLMRCTGIKDARASTLRTGRVGFTGVSSPCVTGVGRKGRECDYDAADKGGQCNGSDSGASGDDNDDDVASTTVLRGNDDLVDNGDEDDEETVAVEGEDQDDGLQDDGLQDEDDEDGVDVDGVDVEEEEVEEEEDDEDDEDEDEDDDDEVDDEDEVDDDEVDNDEYECDDDMVADEEAVGNRGGGRGGGGDDDDDDDGNIRTTDAE